jgi:hypothetical protein
MKRHPFFLASLLLVIIAFGVHFGALSQIQKGLSLKAGSIGTAEQQTLQVRADSDDSFNKGSLLGFIGWFFAAASVACLVVSFHKREPARRSIPSTLLIVYVMLQFLMV